MVKNIRFLYISNKVNILFIKYFFFIPNVDFKENCRIAGGYGYLFVLSLLLQRGSGCTEGKGAVPD